MKRRKLIKDFFGFVGAILLSPFAKAQPNIVQSEGFNSELFHRMKSEGVTCIAFGSCNRSNNDQSFWQTVSKQKPDLWLWLGDAVYLKSDRSHESQFQQLKRNKFYRSLRSHVGAVLGIWDDNDFGSNAQGTPNPTKVEDRETFLNFIYEGGPDIEELLDSHQFGNNEAGLYHSLTIGPEDRRTQFILLDTSFHKISKGSNQQLLGEKQWDWLENGILRATAPVIVITSGIQVITKRGKDKGHWRAFRKEQRRFVNLIEQKKKMNPEIQFVILSGDRHFGEILQETEHGNHVFYEPTSSGLTHKKSQWSMLKHQLNSGKNRVKFIGDKNFGMLEIDWTNGNPRLTSQFYHPQKGTLLENIPLT